MELGIAYCQKELRERRTLVGLQTDERAAFPGSRLNPMVWVPLEYVAEDEETLLQILDSYRYDSDIGVSTRGV